MAPRVPYLQASQWLSWFKQIEPVVLPFRPAWKMPEHSSVQFYLAGNSHPVSVMSQQPLEGGRWAVRRRLCLPAPHNVLSTTLTEHWVALGLTQPEGTACTLAIQTSWNGLYASPMHRNASIYGLLESCLLRFWKDEHQSVHNDQHSVGGFIEILMFFLLISTL